MDRDACPCPAPSFHGKPSRQAMNGRRRIARRLSGESRRSRIPFRRIVVRMDFPYLSHQPYSPFFKNSDFIVSTNPTP
jgi:hypothetical protein